MAALREDLVFPSLDTCYRRLARMIRIASLLLGAALLCAHGAFARRVVSGESEQHKTRDLGFWGGMEYSALGWGLLIDLENST